MATLSIRLKMKVDYTKLVSFLINFYKIIHIKVIFRNKNISSHGAFASN
jgi:hypothetical protein